MHKFNKKWDQWQKNQQLLHEKRVEEALREELGDQLYERLKQDGRLPGQQKTERDTILDSSRSQSQSPIRDADSPLKMSKMSSVMGKD